METQPTTPFERELYGESCVKVVFGRPVGPGNSDVEKRLQAFVPPGVEIQTADDGYVSAVYLRCSSDSVKRYVEEAIDGKDGIDTRINRFRKWVATHSYIYYVEGTTVVPDSVWDTKALQLARMQNVHPSRGTWHSGDFKEFDGSTGMSLPRTRKIKESAEKLLEDH